MAKPYFGSYSLKYTIRKVKEAFPECKIFFYQDEITKTVTFDFAPETRKKYKLSEGVRTYHFLNGHLILSNGPIDPFKYDALDKLIECSELECDVNWQKECVIKIRTAIQNCIDFYDTAIIHFGNKKGSEYDIKFILNDVERAYHISLASDDVHMQKIDLETELENETAYPLNKLGSKVIYKILKTTHPGLRTAATEYISGIRTDKKTWKTAEEAYFKPWKKSTYGLFGISPLDVLADVTESRLVGELVENPMRRLILIDESEYAYRETPLEVIPYDEYRKKRDTILNQYKMDIMKVCKETGVIPPYAIEVMNTYKGKLPGPIILKNADEAIQEIKTAQIQNPLNDIINKINRAIKLYNHKISFTSYVRKGDNTSHIKKIDINETGTVTRIDLNMIDLSLSKPYKMIGGLKKDESVSLKTLKLTQLFIKSLKDELTRFKHKPEHKLLLFTYAMNTLGVQEDDIIMNSYPKIYKSYKIQNSGLRIYVDPYHIELGVNNPNIIETNKKLEELCFRIEEIFEKIFS